MSIDDYRDAARLDVHREFAIPAVIRRNPLTDPTEIYARLHIAGQRPFGDLDREGYGTMIETDNVGVFDTHEWVPKKGDIVDYGRERVFKLDTSMSRPGDRFVAYKLTEYTGNVGSP